jgi:hypothetical protein
VLRDPLADSNDDIAKTAARLSPRSEKDKSA